MEFSLVSPSNLRKDRLEKVVICRYIVCLAVRGREMAKLGTLRVPVQWADRADER